MGHHLPGLLKDADPGPARGHRRRPVDRRARRPREHRPALRPASADAAPRTQMVTFRVAPSPSRTTWCARSRHTCSSARENCLNAVAVLAEFSLRPRRTRGYLCRNLLRSASGVPKHDPRPRHVTAFPGHVIGSLRPAVNDRRRARPRAPGRRHRRHRHRYRAGGPRRGRALHERTRGVRPAGDLVPGPGIPAG